MKETRTQLLHTIEQTRQLLACGRNTVYNLLSRNELTLIKMGRRSLITDESIRDYVAQKILEAQTGLYLKDAASSNARRLS
jgi:excisionase family DNA binding protein